MIFTKDSIFLNLVRGEREHENYGITHTLPYPLVSDEERDYLIENYKFDCRCCGSFKLKRTPKLIENIKEYYKEDMERFYGNI